MNHDTPTAADPMVSTDWLQAHLDDGDLVLIDASWHMPADKRDPRDEHAAQHIPGAVFFDIDEAADRANPLPHMAADPAEFAVYVRRLGVEADSTVVVYDVQGLFSAPRVWWNFRLMGHRKVFVLDGGLRRWLVEGRPVESGWPQRAHGEFKSHFDPGLVADIDQVKAALASGSAQLVDARGPARFTAEAPEPRPGLRSGHMPGARSLPAQGLVQPDGRLAEAETLRRLFGDAGVDTTRPVIATCGSGVSAAILALGLARLGVWDTPVYDGSWSEWGARADTDVASGPA